MVMVSPEERWKQRRKEEEEEAKAVKVGFIFWGTIALLILGLIIWKSATTDWEARRVHRGMAARTLHQESVVNPKNVRVAFVSPIATKTKKEGIYCGLKVIYSVEWSQDLITKEFFYRSCGQRDQELLAWRNKLKQ